jgi:hypothetical protein
MSVASTFLFCSLEALLGFTLMTESVCRFCLIVCTFGACTRELSKVENLMVSEYFDFSQSCSGNPGLNAS